MDTMVSCSTRSLSGMRLDAEACLHRPHRFSTSLGRWATSVCILPAESNSTPRQTMLWPTKGPTSENISGGVARPKCLGEPHVCGAKRGKSGRAFGHRRDWPTLKPNVGPHQEPPLCAGLPRRTWVGRVSLSTAAICVAVAPHSWRTEAVATWRCQRRWQYPSPIPPLAGSTPSHLLESPEHSPQDPWAAPFLAQHLCWQQPDRLADALPHICFKQFGKLRLKANRPPTLEVSRVFPRISEKDDRGIMPRLDSLAILAQEPPFEDPVNLKQ